MSDGTGYSEEERGVLAKAPSKIGHAVMIASSTRFFGAGREMRAMEEALDHSCPPGESELVDGIREAARTEMKAEGWHRDLRKRRKEYHQETLELCRKVGGILKRDQEGENFRRWLMNMGTKVAMAFPTDEFMGIGGVFISRDEETLLLSIANALGIDDYHVQRDPLSD